MASELLNAEFLLWVQNLSESTAKVQSMLSTDSKDDLQDAFDDMLVDLEHVEALRPSKKVTYDFTTALPHIATAKRLKVRASRFVKSTPTQTTPSPPEGATRRIPELHITPFNGDITTFQSFMEAFRLKFDTLKISGSEKLQHLKELLGEGPKKIVEKLQLTDDNYTFAINQLKSQYEKEDEVISALYNKLEKLPPANESTNSIRDTYYELEGLLTALQSHNQELDSFPPLRDKVLHKYPLAIIEKLCINKKPTIKEFQAEILKLVQFRTSMEPTSTVSNVRHAATAALYTSTSKGNTSAFPRNDKHEKTDKPIPTCVFCKQRHYSSNCTTYSTLLARRPLVKDRCYLCLSKEHQKMACPKKTTCFYCKQQNKHNTALCPTQFDPERKARSFHAPQSTVTNDSKEPASSSKTPVTPNTSNNTAPLNNEKSTETPRVVSFIRTHEAAHTTALVTIINPETGHSNQVRALFDNGSNETYITESAARRLSLSLSDFRCTPVTVFLNDAPIKLRTASTYFTMSNQRDFHLDICADTAPHLPQGVHLFNFEEFKQLYPEHANKQFVSQGETQPIEIIIGSDYFYDLLHAETKITVATGLYLFNTPLGWMLVGRREKQTSSCKAVLFQMSPTQAIAELSNLESIGIKDIPLSQLKEEEIALDQFYENLQFIDGRYQVRFPWKEYPPPLKNNFGLAIGRLKTLQRKLTQEQFEVYNQIITQQENAGIIEEVEGALRTIFEHYIPHHPVFTPEKSTSLRIVYAGNTRAKKHDKSINDVMYKGKNLLNDKAGIILRFLFHLIVMLGDLEKAFHALGIDPNDRDYVRFVWIWDFNLPPTGKNLRILRFKRVAFGIISNPFLLLATILYHLQLKKNQFTKKLLRDIYADNTTTGFPDKKSAVEFYHYAVQIFNECSMNLRSWATNDEEIRKIFHHSNNATFISILGVLWNQYDDTLKLKQIHIVDIISLRTVLSTTATFHDPLGWWSPVLITAKIFIHQLHTKYDWDDQLSEEDSVRWLEIRNELQLATEKVIPRFKVDPEFEPASTTYQLHIFTDASEKAYSCVVYLRVCRDQEPPSCSTFLLFSKAKIASKHPIPKLELFGVVLGMHVLQFIHNQLPIIYEKMVLWCDSRCVLHWITGTKILPTFVQRRIDFIRSIDNVEYRYVPSADNPADIATRECTFEQAVTSSWFNGPVWLIQEEKYWPPVFHPEIEKVQPQFEQFDSPVSVVVITAPKYPFDLNPSNFSDYLKLIRVTSYIIQFLVKIRGVKLQSIPSDKPSAWLAHMLWLRVTQNQQYPEIIAALKDKKPHHLVQQLNLYLDKHGIIRCAGRFKHAPLSPEERCPILLPNANEPYTKLLIQHYHESLFHAGANQTLNSIRRRYWLLSGRRVINKLVKDCRKCSRYRAHPYEQPQDSDLPIFRLENHQTPFSNIGIDLFGHLWVQNNKRYVLLVTDLTIRAVKLELLEDASSPEIWLALRRVFAQHSPPKLILSDNAPQFKAIEQLFATTFTHTWSWKYIPEHSPWMGGVYERMVGIAKGSLQRTFHGMELTDGLLRTILPEIAATINSRPLTYIPQSEEQDELVLTPAHFLQSYLFDENTTAEKASTVTVEHLQKFHKRTSEIHNRFWSEWKVRYLQILRERKKYPYKFPQKVSPEPRIGDVVLVAEPNIKRANWKLARIIDLRTSEDEQVRSAVVEIIIAGSMARNKLIRPLKQLYPLEISKDDPKEETPPDQVPIPPVFDADDEIISIEVEELVEDSE